MQDDWPILMKLKRLIFCSIFYFENCDFLNLNLWTVKFFDDDSLGTFRAMEEGKAMKMDWSLL